ncbi:MAG: 50S ribosomal protein L25 [Roseiflexaceae bacterium]|jgi:large subunit ribosomal protein L25|nr:MAG: 50S ribosomal protein L25 [Chloroflexota bacterium]RLT33756.1 MAG: 50S ribosomal protein L25 [Chloroflexota bacterium]
MSIEIKLQKRAVIGKKVNNLRKAGILPATVYGKHLAPINVQTELRSFMPLMKAAGRTNLVTLHIDGEAPIAAFVHTYQRHPVSRTIIHVDFHAVDLNETVEVDVPVHMTGASIMVTRGDALLNNVTSLRVKALPTNLPSSLTVDISVLDSLEKAIHVSDIVLPAGATIIGNGGDLVVGLVPTGRAEVASAENPAQPEVITARQPKA